MDRIYLDHDKSNEMRLNYFNDGDKADYISTRRLISLDGGSSWDDVHSEILAQDRFVNMLGVGYGWWELTEVNGA